MSDDVWEQMRDEGMDIGTGRWDDSLETRAEWNGYAALENQRLLREAEASYSDIIGGSFADFLERAEVDLESASIALRRIKSVCDVLLYGLSQGELDNDGLRSGIERVRRYVTDCSLWGPTEETT